MKAKSWSITDVGNVRENNEDSHLLAPAHGVFVQADGVGGSQAGEVASDTLVRRIEDHAAELKELVFEGDPVSDREHRERVFSRLLAIVQEANAEIFQLGKEINPTLPSATTCDVLVLAQASAFIAHVGDSRVYLFRDDEIFRITEDHTFSEQLRREKVDDERMLKRYKNVLTRSIGGRPTVDVDALFIDLTEGDRILMCSDGLTDYLSGSELLDYATRFNGNELLAELVNEAKVRGGADNITTVLVEIESVGSPNEGEEGGSFDTMKQVDILGQIGLFESLDLRELIRVLRVVFEQPVRAGEVIMRSGEPGESMYIIADGEVELREGNQTTVLRDGDNFGAFALVRPGSLRWADATSTGRTLLLVVPAERFRNLVEEDPILGNKLLWNLLGSAADHIERLTANFLPSNGEDE